MEPFVRVTSVDGATSAHLLASRLRADGAEVELVGPGLGPYQFNVGAMARVDVLVRESDLDTVAETFADLGLAFRPERAPDRAPARFFLPSWTVPALLLALGVWLLWVRATS